MNDNDSQISPGADGADLFKAPATNPGAVSNPPPPPGDEGSKVDAPANDAGSSAETAGVVSTAPGKKPAPGLIGKLSKFLGGGETVNCTCGRAGSGKQGRHAKTCPVSGAAPPKHFGPVTVAQSDAPAPGSVALVPELPSVPVDYSLWGRLSKTVLSLVDRACYRHAFNRCAPVIGREDALAVASDISFAKKDIEDFCETAVRCAEYYKKNPKHAPLFDLALQGANLGVHVWAGFSRMDERLAKIQAAQEKKNQTQEETAR